MTQHTQGMPAFLADGQSLMEASMQAAHEEAKAAALATVKSNMGWAGLTRAELAKVLGVDAEDLDAAGGTRMECGTFLLHGMHFTVGRSADDRSLRLAILVVDPLVPLDQQHQLLLEWPTKAQVAWQSKRLTSLGDLSRAVAAGQDWVQGERLATSREHLLDAGQPDALQVGLVPATLQHQPASPALVQAMCALGDAAHAVSQALAEE